MAKKTCQQCQLLRLLLFFLLTDLFHTSRGDVGTAAHYSPPYSPTTCNGNDPTQFPSSNFFAAAGDGIWDNGASCGRQYLVRCISATTPGTCIVGQTIQIIIVDYSPQAPSVPSAPGMTMVLSETAFGTIANLSADSINVEFQQYVSLVMIIIISFSIQRQLLNFQSLLDFEV